MDEMELDLQKVKIFDMNIRLESVTLILPANGVFSKFVDFILFPIDSIEFLFQFDTITVYEFRRTDLPIMLRRSSTSFL